MFYQDVVMLTSPLVFPRRSDFALVVEAQKLPWSKLKDLDKWLTTLSQVKQIG